MKVLCVCDGGHVRSVTAARILDKRGHEALAVGAKKASDETLLMLLNWADVVLVLADDAAERLQKRLLKMDIAKTLHTSLNRKLDHRYNVGFDDWKKPQEDSLLMLLRKMIDADPLPT